MVQTLPPEHRTPGSRSRFAEAALGWTRWLSPRPGAAPRAKTASLRSAPRGLAGGRPGPCRHSLEFDFEYYAALSQRRATSEVF